MFTCDATFHMNGHVNRHKCRIWGNKRLCEFYENVPDSPDVNVWFGKSMVMETLSRHAFTWIRNKCVLSYKFDNEQEEGEILLQQDGGPSHIRHEVRVP